MKIKTSPFIQAIRAWKWRKSELNAHKNQSLFDYYIEQMAMMALRWTGYRAARKRDMITLDRVISISSAGAEAEVREESAQR